MFLLPWLPCLSMMRTLIDKVDVRVKVTEGERGGEKKTCFFLFSLPVPLPHPLLVDFCRPEEDACYAGTFHLLYNMAQT